MRARIDKNDPNALRVANNVKQSIMEPVSQEDIISATVGLKSVFGAPEVSLGKREEPDFDLKDRESDFDD